MRRMFSEKQIERFAEKVAKRVIEQGINIDHIYTSDENNNYLLMTDEGAIVPKNPADLDIAFKSVSEEGDTALIDLSSYVNSGFAKSNTLYAKLLVKHGILNIVCSGNIVCAGNSATNADILSNFISAVPEAIRSKIYRADGTNITETPVTGGALYAAVAGNVGFRSYSGASSNNQPFVLMSIQANALTLQGRPVPAFTEDTELFIDFRIQLTI